jgi:hypothetical protein
LPRIGNVCSKLIGGLAVRRGEAEASRIGKS